MATILADIPLCERVKEIIRVEGMVVARVAEGIGVCPTNFSAWLNGDVWGKERRARVERWLSEWDAGEIDLQAMKEKKPSYEIH